MRCFSIALVGLLWLSARLAGAADVVMAFSEELAPYTFPQTDSGVQLDVAREALAFRGHRLVPHYFPLERLPLAFRYGRVDALMMDVGEDLTAAGGHYAEPAVVFENVLITLKARDLIITSPKDMADRLVVGFISAAQRYPDWVAPAKALGLYFEAADQELQTLGLLRGHFDVMLTDRYIFHYFANKLARERGQPLHAVSEHSFVSMSPNNYRPVFRDPAIRDDFNAGLRHLKASGRFDAIYRHYLQVDAGE